MPGASGRRRSENMQTIIAKHETAINYTDVQEGIPDICNDVFKVDESGLSMQ